ncbi:MAG: sugar transferase [Thermoleophilia bacterium]
MEDNGSPAGSTVKRLLDMVASVILLVPALPLIFILGLLVRLDSRGPAFYVAERLGRNGRIFKMYKLRTMKHLPAAEGNGLPLTHAGDLRTTGLGRLLRRIKADELPQIINVVKGDMSFVGPRPEDPFFLPCLGEHAGVLLSCRPGITGPASIEFSNEEAMLSNKSTIEHYVKFILPKKVALDLTYIDNWSLATDMKIIAGTLTMPFRRMKEKRINNQLN